MMRVTAIVVSLFVLALSGCAPSGGPRSETSPPEPKEIIDLGALVTEDLPERVWGKRLLVELGYTRPNTFDVIHWQVGSVSGSNGYYTLFNHGGPHVDAPNHMGFTGGVDAYPVESLAGPLRVFDFSKLPAGRTITAEMFEGKGIRPGDIVMIYTDYKPPEADDEYPQNITLTRGAADYLGRIPVRAFATDSFSVDSWAQIQQSLAEGETERADILPVHDAFLGRAIPTYEQLFNADRLLGKENMFFVGVPLSIKDGDGMIVRPVVFVY